MALADPFLSYVFYCHRTCAPSLAMFLSHWCLCVAVVAHDSLRPPGYCPMCHSAAMKVTPHGAVKDGPALWVMGQPRPYMGLASLRMPGSNPNKSHALNCACLSNLHPQNDPMNRTCSSRHASCSTRLKSACQRHVRRTSLIPSNISIGIQKSFQQSPTRQR